jgi:O-antigen ligase/tetratricopeptide (TPR) repeat protein
LSASSGLIAKAVKVLTREGRPTLWVVLLLVVVSPFPEGSAWPWALAIIEAVIFGLAMVWLLAVAWQRSQATISFRDLALALPVLLFVVLLMVQLIPLPPALLRAVSPATYHLYSLSLSGWPRGKSNAVLDRAETKVADWKLLPTINEVAGGTAAPSASAGREKGSAPTTPATAPRILDAWRSIAIAPSLTGRALLEVAAYAALFFLLLIHPIGAAGSKTERTVYRAIVMAVLVSGVMVAAVGIIEFFAWNGKILWMLVPYDWGTPRPSALSRAIGPFVNPDHFGDYLALVLPLAVSGALFRSDLFSKPYAFRVFSAVAAFLIVGALLLSLSRGAWIASVLALAVLFGVSGQMPQEARPRARRLGRGALMRRAIVPVATVIVLSLLFIGPQGREQIDLRLQNTVYNDSGFGGRLQLAGDTLAMVRDYPLLGIGLGCWPELFPHYRRPPWSAVMYREAHNDYVQLLAETGVVGFGLVVWFIVAVVRRLYPVLNARDASLSPTFAAVCAALAMIAFHEFFDFSLHTPANALLVTVLLSMAIRMADDRADTKFRRVRLDGWRGQLGAGSAATILAAFIVCVSKQDKVPYPHNIKAPLTEGRAAALIVAHPAESAPHLDMVRLGGELLPPPQRLTELYAAVWLDPTNPYVVDAYASALLQQGNRAQALAYIARSVMDSPSASTHFYLDERLIPWLSAPEKTFIERGYRQAIERGYVDAVQGLASFYGALGRFGDAGRVYREAAEQEFDPELREDYLVGAGVSYARSGDLANAQSFFESAIQNDPRDDRSYQYLVTMVLGPRRELKAAQEVVAQGLRAGVDRAALYTALAGVARTEGDMRLTETALCDAVDAQPTLGSLLRLGMFYLDEKKYDRAALTLRRATETSPQSADAYFYLGLAEESGYRFSEATTDLYRAVQLAPANAGYRAHYLDFERRIAQSVKVSRSE